MPAPAPKPPAAPGHRLAHPQAANDLLMYRLNRLIAVAGSLVVRLCEGGHGITRREWRMLAQLGQGEGLASSALAERAGLDRAQTSRAVGGLVGKRLVARTPRPGDRREVLLHLTDEGRAVYNALLPRIAAINRDLLSVLAPTEVEVLDGLLRRLNAQALRVGAVGDDVVPKFE